MTKKIIQKNQQKSNDPKTVHEHLLELRSRLLVYTFFFVIAAIGCYYFNQFFIDLLTAPLNQKLYYNNPAGGFEFSLKVAFFLAFILTVPILVYQLLRFIEPVFPWRSTKLVAGILSSSVLLVCAGISVAYFLVIPASLRFLTSFGNETIQPLISANEYFSFTILYLAGFAILFQLPLIMMLLSWFTGWTAKTFLRFQRIIIVVCFILSAIITPTPDIFNLMLFALPLLILYYVAILAVWASSRFHSNQK